MATTYQNEASQYLLIGGGPAGIAGARNLQKYGVPFEGVEAFSDFGGLWNIDNPRSTVYESAHLISSKRMTEFKEFPMKDSVADYPSHKEMSQYFKDFAKHFDLYAHYRFNTRIEKLEPIDGGKSWKATFDNGESKLYKGVIIANGTLSEPNMPNFKGQFGGELIHSAQYKSAKVFDGKRVLIVGAGNSGCDIAVDAIYHSKKVDLSVRRGYHFIPKYIMGKPADSLGGTLKLPGFFKKKLDATILKIFTGDPVRFGFPAPDHKLYESHPIINSLILHFLGHGDIKIKADIDHFEGKTVHFKDGSKDDYDLILCATGYKLHYPFIEKEFLNWKGACPELYLNIFHPTYNNLFVLGMIEATGIGWEGRYEQGELIAKFLSQLQKNPTKVQAFISKKKENNEDLRGGMNYIKLDRMAYYVHKDTYRKKVRDSIADLS
ncbi:MAG: flavin-containing monooxygenase [Bacteriovoracaceae bacterium]